MQDGRKAVSFFPSLKQNFNAHLSSEVSSRPDCIFENHQLWPSGFSRVYSNCCCSCPFQPEIIKIGQSSHKMYSNNILNFPDYTTILNSYTKKVWKLIVCPSYMCYNLYSSVNYFGTKRCDAFPTSRRQFPVPTRITLHCDITKFMLFIQLNRCFNVFNVVFYACWTWTHNTSFVLQICIPFCELQHQIDTCILISYITSSRWFCIAFLLGMNRLHLSPFFVVMW